MTAAVATVMKLTGQAWAQTPDGMLRVIAEGDTLRVGEFLVLAEGADVVLDFGGGDFVTLSGLQTIQISEAMASDFQPSPDESELAFATVDEALASILAALDAEQDPLESIDAPAAGSAGGAEGGGHSTVRLMRIVEELDELAFDGLSVAGDDAVVLASTGGFVEPEENGVVDTQAPTLTVSVPTLTNDNSPTVSGTSDEIGGTVTLVVTDANGDQQTLTAVVQPDGTYSVEVSTPLADGPYSVSGSITDAAGNTGSANDTGAIDTSAPSLSVSAPDGNDNTPTLTGSSDEIGGTVTLVVTDANGDQQTLTAVVQPDGTYSVDVGTPLADGPYSVSGSITDAAGNTGSANDTGAIDTSAPSLSVSAPDGNDNTPTLTGTSDEIGGTVTLVVTDANGDQQTLTAVVQPDGTYSVEVSTPLADGPYTVTGSITDTAGNIGSANDTGAIDTSAPSLTVSAPDGNDSTPTLTGTSDEIGGTVTLVVTDANGDQQTLTAVVQPDGTYSVDVSTPLADGPYTVSGSITDAAGNTGSANDTGAIDTSAPSVAITGISDDTGTAGDFITSDTTLVFRGTTEANARVEVSLDGSVIGTVTADGSGNWSLDYTGTPLSEGSYTVSAIATDAAGNNSAPASQLVTIDTTAPSISITGISDDTGTAGDFITSDTTLVFRGTTEANASVEVSLDGSVIGTVTADGSGNWSLDYTGTALSEGSYTVSAIATDAAGNNSAPASQLVTIDTTAPGVPGDGNSIAFDDADGLINDAEKGSVTFSGQLEDGATLVSLVITDNAGGSVTVDPADISVAADGSISVTGQDLSGLADGPLTVTLTATDLAGNNGSVTDDAVLDTTAPGVPGDGNAIAFDDADGLINDAEKGSVTFSGQLEDGATLVSLVITDNAGGSVTVDPADISVAADGSISVTGQDLSGLADGPLTVTLTATDLAGNSGSVTDDAVLDTTAPNVAITGISDDTGTAGDFITSDTTLVFRGTTEANASVEVSLDGSVIGTVTADGSGNWSLDYTGTPLSEGSYTVSAIATDAAGNSSAPASQLVTIDTTAPGVLGDGNSIAFDDADGLINDAEKGSVTFSGQLEDGATLVSLVITDTAGGSVTVDPADISVAADGSISVSGQDLSGLADGPLTVTLTATDLAGNNGSVTDDAVLSTDGPSISITGISDDTGTAGDFITSDTTLVFRGTTEANASVEVSLDGSVIGTVTADGSGNWSLDYTGTPLSEGSYTVSAIATDAAGNNSAPASQLVTIDTTAPGVPGDGNSIAFDDADGLINDAEKGSVTFSGQLEDGATLVSLVITDNAGGSVTVDPADISVAADGSISVSGQDLSGLADGPLTVTLTATDLAGNNGSVTDDAVLDTTAPGVPGDGNAIAFDDADGLINDAEKGSVTFSGQLEDGATLVSLVITDNAGGSVTVDLADISVAADGSISVSGQDLSGLADGPLTVTLTATDLAGNNGSVTDDAVLDTTAPGVPGDGNSIAFDDADGLINDAEKGSVTFSGQLEDGATLVSLVITDNAGGSVTVDPADISVAADGSISVSGQDLSALADGPLTVTLTATDLAGNSGSVTDDAVLDTTAPGVPGDGNSIAFDDADGLINDAEKGSVTFSGQLEEGATLVSLVITDNAGGSVTVDPADISVAADGSISVSGQDLSGLADGPLTVTLTATDLAGNNGSVTDDAVLDRSRPVLEITSDQSTLASGAEALVTFTFSEAVVGFTLSDVSVDGGELQALSGPVVNLDGSVSYTATFTADASAPISLAVADGSFTDLFGNAGFGDSLSINAAPLANNLMLDTDEDVVLTGNVLANDSDPDGQALSVTGFVVNGASAVAGETLVVAGQGSITVQANGDFSFEPFENWSGDFPAITYTVTDGAGGSDSAELVINVAPVADAPLLSLVGDSSAPDSIGLTRETWNNINLGNSGNGVDAATLINAIDSAGTANSTDQVTSVEAPRVNTFGENKGVKLSGLIYLEAGTSYTFGGLADDSGAIVVGGDLVAAGRWQVSGTDPNGVTGNGRYSGTYTPTVSGYYTLDIYTHNQHSFGGYDVLVSENGGPAVILSTSSAGLFPDLAALEAQGVRVGSFDGDSNGGFFTEYGLNEGVAGQPIPLSGIVAELVDTDGSETLAIFVEGLPVGTILTDGLNSFTATSAVNSVEVTGWDLGTLTAQFPVSLSGDITLNVRATSTEVANGDTEDSVVGLVVSVDPASGITIDSVTTASETGVDVIAAVWGSVSTSQFGVATFTIDSSNPDQTLPSTDLNVTNRTNLQITSGPQSNNTNLFEVGDVYTVSYQSGSTTRTFQGTVTRSDRIDAQGNITDIVIFSGRIGSTNIALVVDTRATGVVVSSTNDYFTNDRSDTIVGFQELIVTGTASAGATVELFDASSALVATVLADADGNWSTKLSGVSPSGGLRAEATDLLGNNADASVSYQVGRKSGDNLVGTSGDDVLYGGAGNDTINAGAGDDVLIGGSGNDILTGGLGADVFRWELGDQGSTATPAVDRVTDFTLDLAGGFTGSGQADRLDIADLLQGENELNIGNYLRAEQSGADTLLFINSQGNLAGGHDQLIRLENVSMGGLDSDAFVNALITNGQLTIDQ